MAPQARLSNRVEHQICALVALGLPLSSAARLAGINERTVHDWFSLGAEPGAAEHWREFRQGVEWARLEYARAIASRLAELRGD